MSKLNTKLTDQCLVLMRNELQKDWKRSDRSMNIAVKKCSKNLENPDPDDAFDVAFLLGRGSTLEAVIDYIDDVRMMLHNKKPRGHKKRDRKFYKTSKTTRGGETVCS